MTHPTLHTRWHRIAATALILLATLGYSASGMARESAAEKANVKVVNGFIAAWNNPDQAVTFLAPNAAVRMVEDQPAVIGPTAVAATFKSFLPPEVSLSVKTLATTAHGPVVMNKRIDTLKTAGKPDQVFHVVGVFVVKDGKITEWSDYLEQ